MTNQSGYNTSPENASHKCDVEGESIMKNDAASLDISKTSTRGPQEDATNPQGHSAPPQEEVTKSHGVAGNTKEPTAPVTEHDLKYLGGAPQLVVAMDFDGTLAPFSDDPSACRAEDGAIEALTELSQIPGTTVVVISGRNLTQLSDVTGLDPQRASEASSPGDGIIRMVGSHGAEAADQPTSDLSETQRTQLTKLKQFAEDQAKRTPGMWVEYKPFSVSLHVRTAEDKTIASAAVSEFQRFAQRTPGSKITLGKDIFEVAVSQATKGSYMSELLERMSPPVDAVVFAGDDTTDETVMAILHKERDISIKVGEGSSQGNRRLDDCVAVRDFLVRLASIRSSMISSLHS
ncbi:trehalose-phosphatase [Corynebacterium anserum]|uniref:Trehalose 6-phosphate phosphatase n=1 Tax=Corynebacterium anserum TaxID=2684406 RepID=A0A7G7YM51_9CORY|nr:trehalose-phosphatase [Corynebacterium anserum]MBC2681248.1 trehalose-phosphatase [Corynebacterium anserum]QNH95571.1 trehalose-phosphatase [Corynebacterium anserum]